MAAGYETLNPSAAPRVLRRYSKMATSLSDVSEAYTTVAPGAINSGYMSRCMWPDSGVIDRLMMYCNLSGAGNFDMGIYDTTPVTRNRLVSSGSTALVASSWNQVTVSLNVNAGDMFEFAFGVDNIVSTFAFAASNTAPMTVLPTGWMPITSGGEPRLNGYKAAGMFPLPATVTYATVTNDLNFPLILARYV